jgi:hypothetical protein
LTCVSADGRGVQYTKGRAMLVPAYAARYLYSDRIAIEGEAGKPYQYSLSAPTLAASATSAVHDTSVCVLL